MESEFSIPKLFLQGGLLLMLRESLLQTLGGRMYWAWLPGPLLVVTTGKGTESWTLRSCKRSFLAVSVMICSWSRWFSFCSECRALSISTMFTPASPLPCFSRSCSMFGVAWGTFSSCPLLLQDTVWSKRVGRLLMGDMDERLSWGDVPRQPKLQSSRSGSARLLSD